MSHMPQTKEWEKQSQRWSVMSAEDIAFFAAQSFAMHDEMEGELDALRAEIEKLQAQEPV